MASYITKRLRQAKSYRGASMVEVAASIPLFLLFILFIIDIARYFFIYSLVNLAAHEGVDYASKIIIETNTRQQYCIDHANECAAYLHRLFDNTDQYNSSTIVGRTLAQARNAGSSSTVDSTARLVRFRHYGAGYEPPLSNLAPFDADIAFMRPGERVEVLDINGNPTGETIEHLTRGWAEDSIPGKGWPKQGENWDSVLALHPLEVRVRVLLKPFTPLIPVLTVESRAHAYRKVLTYGRGGGDAPSPTSTPLPTNTFTPTPTVTFTPTGPTPTPSNTPTATPTRTPTNTPTPTSTGPTITPSNTPTTTPTHTPDNNPTNTPTITPTPLPTATRTPNCSMCNECLTENCEDTGCITTCGNPEIRDTCIWCGCDCGSGGQ